MLFSELVLQGVRNFQHMHRIPVGDGFSVFVGAAGSGKSTIVDVLVRLLNPDPTEPATDEFKGSDPKLCRVALLISTGDQSYRLVQDLLRGSMVLARLDPATSQFVTITNSPAEIQQYLSSQIQLPQKDILEGIFVFRQAVLPSKCIGNGLGAGVPPAAAVGAKQATQQGSGLPPSPHFPPQDGGGGDHFPGYQGLDPQDEVLPDDPTEIRSQLESLRGDLAMAKEVDDLQFKLDGLQSELFEFEQKMKGVKEAEALVGQLQEQTKQFGQLSGLPDDFERRVRDFESAKEKLDRDLARLDEDEEKWTKQAAQTAPEPLGRDRTFLLGLLVGIAALGVGIAGFFLYESLRWVALLDIIGFGVAVVAAIRHMDLSQSAERGKARLEMIGERREKIQRQFDLESSIVRRTMADAKVENPRELLDRYAQRNELSGRLEKAQGALQKKREDPAFAAAKSKYDVLKDEIEGIEQKLAGSSGLMMGVSEMERRIGLLEDKLQGLESGLGSAGEVGTGAPGPGETGPDPYGLGVGAPPGASFEGPDSAGLPPSPALVSEAPDPFEPLLKLAADIFLIERERMELMLAPLASQYLAVLTSGSLRQLQFGQGGKVEFMDPSGNWSPATGLPAAEQDKVYLALRFAVTESACRQRAVPLLLDDPFASFESGMRDTIGHSLAKLGESTQVVMFAGDSSWAQYSGASFRL